MIPGQQLDWRSACLFCVADPDWRRKLWLGGLFLLLPVLGWPIILGYRKEAILGLVNGRLPILPDWNQGLFFFFREGLKAMGVIYAYFLPVYLWLGWRCYSEPGAKEIPWLVFALVVVVFPIFSTLVLPLIVFYIRYLLPEAILSPTEASAMLVTYTLITFCIPAGFLNVSKTNRMLSAFSIRTNLKLIARTFPAYLEAWIGASLLSLVSHLCIPFAPWGVVWCYLSIVYCFNEIPLVVEQREGDYLSHSWFRVFRTQYWSHFHITQNGALEQFRVQIEASPSSEPSTRDFFALRWGFIRAPIP